MTSTNDPTSDTDREDHVVQPTPELDRRSLILAALVCLVAGLIYVWVTGRQAAPRFDSPLHKACYEGDLSKAKSLVAGGANVNLQGPRNVGDTPLMLAIASDKNSVAIASLLISHGADVRLTDKAGRTALHVAVLYGSIPIVQMLLDHHADINAPDKEGARPLSYSGVWTMNKPMKNYLIARGAK